MVKFILHYFAKKDMNDFENYENLVNEIFGSNTISISNNSSRTNNFIATLNHQGQFHDFFQNYTSRLRRLSNIYSVDDRNRKELLTQVKEIASTNYGNCIGAYSEIVALDYLNQSDSLIEPIVLS